MTVKIRNLKNHHVESPKANTNSSIICLKVVLNSHISGSKIFNKTSVEYSFPFSIFLINLDSPFVSRFSRFSSVFSSCSFNFPTKFISISSNKPFESSSVTHSHSGGTVPVLCIVSQAFKMVEVRSIAWARCIEESENPANSSHIELMLCASSRIIMESFISSSSLRLERSFASSK